MYIVPPTDEISWKYFAINAFLPYTALSLSSERLSFFIPIWFNECAYTLTCRNIFSSTIWKQTRMKCHYRPSASMIIMKLKKMLQFLGKEPLSYEGRFTRSDPSFISMQPLSGEHANIPHMKAIYVPFHMGYGRLTEIHLMVRSRFGEICYCCC